MTPRLGCRSLTGGRGNVAAFRDVDLEVEAGRIMVLLGPNGSGKTTLLLTIAGLLARQTGAVDVDGHPVRSGRPRSASRAGIVLVPDNRCLFPSLSVAEHLRAASRRDRDDVAGEIVELFPGLEPRWRVPAGALSGGEQQMLALARALIQEPKVLLIDEMSMGLAPLVTEALFEAVRNIADQRSCAVVLVEQHVDIALQAADDAAVLSRGSIVLRGSANDLRNDPAGLESAYFGS